MNKTLHIVACLSAALVGCGDNTDTRKSAPYEIAKKASVEIIYGGHLDGSGWFAHPSGLVVTAAHIFGRQEHPVEVNTSDGSRLPAEIIAMDRGNDIALLQVKSNGKRWQSLEVAKATPAPGARVFLYGAALYRHSIMLGGTVARNTRGYSYFGDRGTPILAYAITSPSPPGTSGGPWLNASGKVVGNQSGFVTHKGAGAGIAIVTPPDAIRHLVETRKSVVTPSLGCGLEELWSQSRGFIKRFPTGVEGVVTVPLRKGEAAEKAGLTRESLITQIDGKPARYRADVYAYVCSKKPGDKIKLRVYDPDKPEPRDIELELGSLD